VLAQVSPANTLPILLGNDLRDEHRMRDRQSGQRTAERAARLNVMWRKRFTGASAKSYVL